MNGITHTLHAITIDPLHIGAGGYRLGRVDNSIVREPGTNIPKVPGSTIAGVDRNYAIYGLDGEEREAAVACATKQEADGSPAKDQNNCGRCAICQTFGFASPEGATRNQIGRVKFFDARILAFPVRSLAGPVWVSTPSILGAPEAPPEDRLFVNFDIPGGLGRLNLGWLYLKTEKRVFGLPEAVCADPAGKAMHDRLVLTPEWLFAEIVNSNLEVRTSVAIDFATGAAKSKALFTYEAIPRATLLSFDVVVDAYRCTGDWPAERVAAIVAGGLRLFETLGAGGMNTRGFGRMRILGLEAMEGGAA